MLLPRLQRQIAQRVGQLRAVKYDRVSVGKRPPVIGHVTSRVRVRRGGDDGELRSPHEDQLAPVVVVVVVVVRTGRAIVGGGIIKRRSN